MHQPLRQPQMKRRETPREAAGHGLGVCSEARDPTDDSVINRVTTNPVPGRLLFEEPPVVDTTYPPELAGDSIRGYVTPPGSAWDHNHPQRYERFTDHALVTLDGDVRVAPLYLMATGSIADPSQSATSAGMYYAGLGTIAGWLAMGENSHGVWVSGIFTGNDVQREALAKSTIRCDFRRDDDDRRVPVGLWAKVDAYVVPDVAYGLTKGQLVRALTTGDLAELPDDTPLIMAKDSEGNGYSPLSALAQKMYMPESTWSGEVFPTPDQAPGSAVHAILLDPTN